MTPPKTKQRKKENNLIREAIEHLPSNTDTRQMAGNLCQRFNVSKCQIYGNLSTVSRWRFRIIQVVIPRKRSVLL